MMKWESTLTIAIWFAIPILEPEQGNYGLPEESKMFDLRTLRC
jgi:hypothetical protein